MFQSGTTSRRSTLDRITRRFPVWIDTTRFNRFSRLVRLKMDLDLEQIRWTRATDWNKYYTKQEISFIAVSKRVDRLCHLSLWHEPFSTSSVIPMETKRISQKIEERETKLFRWIIFPQGKENSERTTFITGRWPMRWTTDTNISTRSDNSLRHASVSLSLARRILLKNRCPLSPWTPKQNQPLNTLPPDRINERENLDEPLDNRPEWMVLTEKVHVSSREQFRVEKQKQGHADEDGRDRKENVTSFVNCRTCLPAWDKSHMWDERRVFTCIWWRHVRSISGSLVSIPRQLMEGLEHVFYAWSSISNRMPSNWCLCLGDCFSMCVINAQDQERETDSERHNDPSISFFPMTNHIDSTY